MSSLIKDEMIDWWYLARHIKVPHLTIEENRNAFFFKGSLFPYAMPYYSPFYPSFLFFEKFGELENIRHPVLVRDGAFPLADFFHRHTPERFPNEFLVHESLAKWVSSQWKAQVRYYSVSARRTFQPGMSLLLGLPMNQMVISLIEVEELLEGLFKSADLSVAKEIKLMAPSSQSVLGLDMVDFLKDAKGVLRKYFKKDVEMVSYHDLCLSSHFHNLAYFELNNGRVVADSFAEHLFFSKGAASFKKFPRGDVYVPLSLNHGLNIYDKPPKNPRRTAFHEDSLIAWQKYIGYFSF